MAEILGAKVHGVQLEGVTVSYYLACNTLQSCKTIYLSSKLKNYVTVYRMTFPSIFAKYFPSLDLFQPFDLFHKL